MCETLIADGIASGAGEKLATFAIKCLAVGGGFLVGYFVGGAIAWALDRWVLAHKAPDQLKKACSVICGIALAIIVALIVFGEGGAGLFGGGGSSGDKKGTQAPDDTGKQQPAPVVPKEEPKKEVPKKEDPKKEVPKTTPGDVRIAILGEADVRPGKDGEGMFYQIDNESAPKTLTELKKTISDRRDATKTEVVLVFRFAKEPLSDTHPEMKRRSAWVKEAKLLSRFE